MAPGLKAIKKLVTPWKRKKSSEPTLKQFKLRYSVRGQVSPENSPSPTRREITTNNNEVDGSTTTKADSLPTKKKDLFNYIRRHIIGRDQTFIGPFGERRVVYCDNTASGRSLDFIENYIQEMVLPTYGNTHTTTSVTSQQTTAFRNDARELVATSVNASDEDTVIFAGSGSTAAINKLVHILNLTEPPIVFLSPFEHHSNLLPWKEAGAKIVWSRQKPNGDVDIEHLERELKKHSHCTQRVIGSFSAGSNLTGILVNTDEVAACLHRNNALAIFDYAGAGPYVNIDMNPGEDSEFGALSYKDAIVCSPHKFVGGPGTVGVLVCKSKLFNNNIPSAPGGGTVVYVTETSHKYTSNLKEREEGGTPAIVESIRTGMVFELKDAITAEKIMERDDILVERAAAKWKYCPNLIVLGGFEAHRLPIFSFCIRHPSSKRLLHHNFVSKLMSDLFGIQSRGGCMCAGPYAERLLGIDEDLALRIGELLFDGQNSNESNAEILKPGFCRLNLPYYAEDSEIDFIIDAVAMVAEHGWKLLPRYKFDANTGDWQHEDQRDVEDRKLSLKGISYLTGSFRCERPNASRSAPSLGGVLMTARYLFENSIEYKECLEEDSSKYSKEWEALRWFLLPSEAQSYLNGNCPVHYKELFTPGKTPSNDKRSLSRTISAQVCACKRSTRAGKGHGLAFPSISEEVEPQWTIKIM